MAHRRHRVFTISQRNFNHIIEQNRCRQFSISVECSIACREITVPHALVLVETSNNEAKTPTSGAKASANETVINQTGALFDVVKTLTNDAMIENILQMKNNHLDQKEIVFMNWKKAFWKIQNQMNRASTIPPPYLYACALFKLDPETPRFENITLYAWQIIAAPSTFYFIISIGIMICLANYYQWHETRGAETLASKTK